MFKLGDYTFIFKATKKVFNLIPVRMKHVIHADVDGIEDTDSLEEINHVVNEYAKKNNMYNVKLLSYTRYVN